MTGTYKILTKFSNLILLLALFCIPIDSIAQDSLVLINKEVKLVKITEVGTTEITYKKFNNLSSSPDYKILKSNVAYISYKDGSKDVFNETSGPKEIKHPPAQVPMKTRVYFGADFSFINSFKKGNLEDFWNNLNGGTTSGLNSGSPSYFELHAGMLSYSDEHGKNRIGAEAQLVLFNSHAIWGSHTYFGGRSEIALGATLFNITMPYARGIDDNNKLFFVFEPGLDIGFMKGHINIASYPYEQSLAMGIGGHFATGLNYDLGPLSLHARLGHRFLKINEMHMDTNSATGYSSFYVNGSSGDTIKVNWGGTYLTIGTSLCLGG